MRRRRWTPEEDALVMAAAWSGLSWVRLARKFDRTVPALVNRAVVLRRIQDQPLAKKARRGVCRRWTAAEDADLRTRDARGEKAKVIAAALGRSKKAIQERLAGIKGRTRAGSKALTIGERTRAIQLARAGKTPIEIAETLGRTLPVVRGMILRAAPEAIQRHRPYAKADDDRIREGVAAGESISSIARAIDRKTGSVLTRMERIGCRPMRKIVGRRNWTTAEVRQALELREAGVTPAEIGARLGRTRHAVILAMRNHRRRARESSAVG